MSFVHLPQQPQDFSFRTKCKQGNRHTIPPGSSLWHEPVRAMDWKNPSVLCQDTRLSWVLPRQTRTVAVDWTFYKSYWGPQPQQVLRIKRNDSLARSSADSHSSLSTPHMIASFQRNTSPFLRAGQAPSSSTTELTKWINYGAPQEILLPLLLKVGSHEGTAQPHTVRASVLALTDFQ